MCVAVVGLVAGCDVDVEVGAHLVDETDVVSGELAGRAFQRAQVHIEELGTFGRQTRPQQFGAQGQGPSREFARLRCRRVLDLSAQRRIAGEGVDETLLEPVEGQAEPQVIGNERMRFHGSRR